MRARERRDLRNGILFILPYIIGAIAFKLYPIVASFYYSLTRYEIFTPPLFTGIDNYRTLFLYDDLFWTSLWNTLYYTALVVPCSLVFSLGIALLLNMNLKGMSVYRTVFFLPTLVPVVASSILWMWVLNPRFGLLNAALSLVGIKGPGWIADPAWSKPSLVMMGVWGAGQQIVIYLAGLKDIPHVFYEAAEIDGANTWQKLRNVTLPLITPVVLFNTVMSIIGSFQVFDQAYIMTDGGPANSTEMYALYLYRNAFQYFNMGAASAQAWILFAIILVCTLLLMRSSERWVHYGGGV